MTWKAYAEFDDFDHRIRLACRNLDHDRGTTTTILPLTFGIEPAENASIARTPVMYEGKTREAKAILQALVDLAWELGIRPAEMADYQRANDAQRRHLEDMRALTFKSASAEPPK
jgi:hypothetical protein